MIEEIRKRMSVLFKRNPHDDEWDNETDSIEYHFLGNIEYLLVNNPELITKGKILKILNSLVKTIDSNGEVCNLSDTSNAETLHLYLSEKNIFSKYRKFNKNYDKLIVKINDFKSIEIYCKTEMATILEPEYYYVNDLEMNIEFENVNKIVDLIFEKYLIKE